MASENIFTLLSKDAPPSVIASRPDHPVKRLGITAQKGRLSTNKFYANFFLGKQDQPSWTHPYSLLWSKGGGASKSWGLSVSHIEANQRAFGPDPKANPVEYFVNPSGIQHVVLSAAELGGSTALTTDTLTSSSVNVNLLASAGNKPAISFPLVQGMGFITGIYNESTPLLQSGVFFRTITQAKTAPKEGVTKFTIVLEDSSTWLVYAHATSGQNLELSLLDHSHIKATSKFQGTLQIAKSPKGAETLYDAACGAYATGSTLTGTAKGPAGTYTMTFSKGGLKDATLLMFALPHLVESFSATTKKAASEVKLQTTTKGEATAVVADSWTMEEPAMPVGLGFAPWSPSLGNIAELSPTVISTVQKVATSDLNQDMSAQSNGDSFYFSGKALAKFAQIVYASKDLLKNESLAQEGLTKLKAAFEVWTTNKNKYPLVYEEAWGGIVSTGGYVTGDSGVDFGNTNYNDHHFHFAYFILAASYIGYLDPTWLASHKEYINTMVRDTANASSEDPYFPVSRGFDWYHGHSWAKGLFDSADGKDQESSAEDACFAYSLKMWGKTIGDANLEARGNLQLSVVARSISKYFLYTSDNTVEPANFIGNKVSGILFENKIHHTTYFGANTEYIQGIHMIPLLPSSTLTRPKKFVTEEWDTYFSNDRAKKVEGGWRGILFANLALIDPKQSYAFFAQDSFDNAWLDGGASRTWYMALAAGMLSLVVW